MLKHLLQYVTGFFLPKVRTAVVSERRGLVRVRCHLPVQLKYKGHVYGGWILDMGLQGLRLRLETPLPAGSEFSMRATLAAQATVPWLDFRVIWSRPNRDKKTFSHGVAFKETEANLKRSWVALLFRELGINEKHAASRRQFLRVDGKIPIEFAVVPTPAGQLPEVEMVNIGVGGLLLRSKQPILKGWRCTVSLGPWEGLPRAGPYAMEVISTKSDDTGLYCLGALRFIEPDEHLVQNVGRYVVKLLRL